MDAAHKQFEILLPVDEIEVFAIDDQQGRGLVMLEEFRVSVDQFRQVGLVDLALITATAATHPLHQGGWGGLQVDYQVRRGGARGRRSA